MHEGERPTDADHARKRERNDGQRTHREI